MSIIITFVLNHLIQTERGPFGLLRKLKTGLTGLHPEINLALNCHVCLSGYTAMIAVLLGGGAKRQWPSRWLATWGGVLLLYEVREWVQLHLSQAERRLQ